MGYIINSNFIIIIITCISRCYYYIIIWSKFKYFIFWPFRRWRPYFISAFILIFWSPWSLYFNFTWIWFNFSYNLQWKKKKRNFWKNRNNLCNNFYWFIRFYCLSSSYIYSRDGCWYTGLFYFSYYNYCSTYWTSNFIS